MDTMQQLKDYLNRRINEINTIDNLMKYPQDEIAQVAFTNHGMIITYRDILKQIDMLEGKYKLK